MPSFQEGIWFFNFDALWGQLSQAVSTRSFTHSWDLGHFARLIRATSGPPPEITYHWPSLAKKSEEIRKISAPQKPMTRSCNMTHGWTWVVHSWTILSLFECDRFGRAVALSRWSAQVCARTMHCWAPIHRVPIEQFIFESLKMFESEMGVLMWQVSVVHIAGDISNIANVQMVLSSFQIHPLPSMFWHFLTIEVCKTSSLGTQSTFEELQLLMKEGYSPIVTC